MPFQKGHKKIGGVKKGTTHKVSARGMVREILEGQIGKSIPERIYELIKGKDFEADMLIDLMPYCYPKLQSMEVTAQVDAKVNTEVQGLVDLLEKMNADK